MVLYYNPNASNPFVMMCYVGEDILYQNAEAKGRKKLEDFLIYKGITDFNFTEDKYNQVDAVLTKNGKTYTIEIKDRNKKYESYPTFIVEKSKVDYMDVLYKKGKTVNSLICQIFGNHLYFFSYIKLKKLIDSGKVKEEKMKLPATTITENSNRYKAVYLVPKEYAYLFIKDSNGDYKKQMIN